jgi:hypothetical protein
MVNGSSAELQLTETIELRRWDGSEGFLGDAKLCQVAPGDDTDRSQAAEKCNKTRKKLASGAEAR